MIVDEIGDTLIKEKGRRRPERLLIGEPKGFLFGLRDFLKT